MEAFDATAIPTVRLQVKSFAAKVHTLLQVNIAIYFIIQTETCTLLDS